MTFAVVEDRLGEAHASSTNHNVDMPATVNSGDILLVWWSATNVSVTVPTGWKQLYSNLQGGFNAKLFIKVANGTEGGSPVNFVSGSATAATTITYRISGGVAWYFDELSTSLAATAYSQANPDPPSLTIRDAAEDVLWLALVKGDSFAPSAAPSGYSNLTTQAPSGSAGFLGIAEKTANAQTENPGAFTQTNTDGDVITLAIRPQTEGMPYLIDHQEQSTGTASVTFDPSNLFPIVDGDVLLAYHTNSGTNGISPPAGWTVIRSNDSTFSEEFAYKIANGESGTYTFTGSGGVVSRAILAIIRGAKPGDEIDASSNVTDSDLGASFTIPSMTLVDRCMVCAFGSDNSGGTFPTQPTGFVEVVPGASSNNGHGFAFHPDMPAGATGGITWTYGGGNTLKAVMVGIKSAAGGAAFTGWGPIPI